ncbi:7-cyano-7-deazaguanine synthase QueC [Hyphomicrobium sp.]|uniref:7-cyano-7-deazaguanine synthase QueC n=1 Tax=Hyphomicrobium sp. TaxID=82 RepID=UPI00356A2DEF
MSETSALVLFSGGQDSTVCLSWALSRYARVETIGFKYGQRHSVELAQRDIIREKLAGLGAAGKHLGPDAVLDLPALQSISDTALTRETEITFAATGLPTTFVPGRNLLFLTYAAALAYRRGITTLVGGMCETDFSGYPDCRNETIQTLAQAISLGLATPVAIETPLMFIDKSATWELASKLGGNDLIDIIIEDTHTCYMGDRTNRHDWGYGCGICPACELRANGWTQWRAQKT